MATQSGVLQHAQRKKLSWPVDLGVKLLSANVLLVLSAQIAVLLPWTPVPVTLQTLGVLLIAVLFGARISAVAAALYLLEGAAGLPVFHPFGVPGPLHFFGPTAGYLLAFPPAAYITGRLSELTISSRRPNTSLASAPVETRDADSAAAPRGAWFGWLAQGAVMVPGDALILFCGWSWLAGHVGVRAAFAGGVVPFLGAECAKIAAAAGIAQAAPRRE
jgi:biotin transport system substrate-specific component